MAIDRFLKWKDKVPSIKEVAIILEDYLGKGAKVELQDKRIFGTVPGTPSFPFKRVVEGMGKEFNDQNERWIEIYMDEKDIDIITRGQDEFTNNVAQGFYELIKRFYQTDKE